MNIISKIGIAISIVLSLCLGGCGNWNGKGSQADSILFADDYGRSVAVCAHPTRVVSVSPAVTEIIFALGAGDILAGRTDFCTYPIQSQRIESIGGISNLNVEKIISLKPDLVISGSMVQKKTINHLETMGIPMVCITEKQTFDGLYQNIASIGKLIGRSHAADSLIATLRERVKKATAQPEFYAPSVYYVVGFGKGGNYTAGGNTFISDIIQMAGGRNIAEDIAGWNISLEALIDANPDFIIIRREDADAFCKMPPYNTLTAVKEGRVIRMESGSIDLQVPRNIDAIIQIRKALSDTNASVSK